MELFLAIFLAVGAFVGIGGYVLYCSTKNKEFYQGKDKDE